jgi:hypothetical protein
LPKGVTVGYAPLGGLLLSPHVRQPFYRDGEQTPLFRHGATYAGHATAGALALHDIDVLEEEKLVPRVAELDVLLTEELDPTRFREAVTTTRVAGLLGGVTLTSRLGAETGTDELTDNLHHMTPHRRPNRPAAAHEAVARIGGGRAGARGTTGAHDPSLLDTVTVSGPGGGRIETAYALLSDIITVHPRHADDDTTPTYPVMKETHRV